MKEKLTCKLLIIFMLSGAFVLSAFGQSVATKKVLLSLQQGENLQISESCIELSYTANQLYVVTRKGDNIFVYEGGQRKGPYNMDAAKLKNCGDSPNETCAAYDPDQPDPSSGIISYTDQGKMTINFKGKTYGPYKFVTAMHMPADKSWFVALVVNNGKYSVISSDGTTQVIEGNGAYLHVSPVSKKFLVVCKEGEGMGAAMMEMDMSNMTQEQLMEMVKKQAEKQQNAGPSQAYIYTNGGKKYGPFSANAVSENNPAFSVTGGDNWYMDIDNALYINGEKVKQYSSDNVSLNLCHAWVSTDGKRYAAVGYNEILFSDGTSYQAPIKIDIEKKDGKTFLKWIALENAKDLNLYTKEL